MTQERYWLALVKQWKLICASIVIVGLGTFIGSKLITPLYQSSVLVQVTVSTNNGQADTNSLIASNDLAQTESVLAVSPSILQTVASHYKDSSTEQLTKEVRASVRANTQLFEIDVTDANPGRAAALANDIAATLIEHQIQLTQQNNSRAQQPIRHEIESTEAQIGTLTTQITSLQAKGGRQAQITALQNQRNSLQQHENQEQTLLAQLELAQAQSGSFLNVDQPATPHSTPVQPDVLAYTYSGLLTGFLLGLLLALLIERFDTGVRTVDSINQQLNGNWPILAIIWKEDDAKTSEALVNPTRYSSNSEAYYDLRTNIGLSAIGKPLQTLVVTSSTLQEGKSTVAANLAISMAESGKKTVLIDANLRHPTQHERFLLPIERQGLSNALLAYSQQLMNPQLTYQGISHDISPEPYMHPVNVPNLRVIPSGPLPPDPPELLDSKFIDRFIARIVRGGADVIIVDTPPLLGLPDSSILAAKADGIIVVIDVTSANKGNLRQLREKLTKMGVNVLGYVANKQRRSHKGRASSSNTANPDKKGHSVSHGYAQSASNRPSPPVFTNPVQPTRTAALSPRENSQWQH